MIWIISEVFPGLTLEKRDRRSAFSSAHAVSKRKVSIMLWAVNEEKVNAYLKMLIASDKNLLKNAPHQMPELALAISFMKSK